MPPKDDELVVLLLETVPMMMGDLRERVRAMGDRDLTLPQLRVLGYVGRHEGASLSDVAEALGLARPQASKLVQALVERGLLARETSSEDRRQVSLRLGETARKRWKEVRDAARASLTKRLAGLTREERAHLAAGLRGLRRVLSEDGTTETRRARRTHGEQRNPP